MAECENRHLHRSLNWLALQPCYILLFRLMGIWSRSGEGRALTKQGHRRQGEWPWPSTL